MKKIIFTILFLLLLTQICSGQKNLEPNLIAKFTETNYELIRSTLDLFLYKIANDKNSKGVIIIHGDNKQPIAKYFFEVLLKKHIEDRRFDNGRITFVHGNNKEDFETKLLIAPKDAEVPDFGEKNWDYKLPQFTEPYLVHKDSWIVEVGFETFSNEFFSKFLLANPHLQGQLIIHEKSTEDYNRKKAQLIEDLVTVNKVPLDKLKFTFAKSDKPDVEFWFVTKGDK